VVVDAPVQMERELGALRQQTGAASARDLDALLAALGAALPAGRVPASVEYGGGALRARGLGLAGAEFEAVAGQLRSQGYVARSEGDQLVVTAGEAP
jgi:general secretion pathway protein L